MSQFLLEIFSEEIPARMQKKAMEDLARLIIDGLNKANIKGNATHSWVAPRRLGLCIEGLPLTTPEIREEKKGPKIDAPQQAIDGFVRAAKINSIADARIAKDDKKGDFYVVDIVTAGQNTIDILASLITDTIQSFPWPKSMRWGEGNLRWVRPIHSIIALFDGKIIDVELENLKASNKTLGHRFHSEGEIIVTDFDDYKAKLAAAHVLIDREARKSEISRQINEICAKNNLELIEDIGLLEEVCGLIDEPHVILGAMDESFLDLPHEVIRLTLRLNQKYFVANSKASGKLAPNFIVVSNVKATDGGVAIAQGNARVLAARLNDARYFWDLDRKSTLISRLPKLDKIVFHQKIGSIGEKVQRITELAGELAPIVGADVANAKRAAQLAKVDLVTEMVGEFPELQGVMGRYYANNDGESQDVANAIFEHYKPIGPSDYVPNNKVSIAVALADKFDTLVSFFAIGEKPSGSGDPYALRRAALGVIRIVLENGIRINLNFNISNSALKIIPITLKISKHSFEINSHEKLSEKLVTENDEILATRYDGQNWNYLDNYKIFANQKSKYYAEELLSFFLDRLKVYLRDDGYAHDVIDAVFAQNDDDLVRIVNRIKALTDFLKTDDGNNLIAGFKRAVNIIKSETKKSGFDENIQVKEILFNNDAEKALFVAMENAKSKINEYLQAEDFANAMKSLASLRNSVDNFFDKVLVNDENHEIRNNRLALLSQLRQMAGQIANFESLN